MTFKMTETPKSYFGLSFPDRKLAEDDLKGLTKALGTKFLNFYESTEINVGPYSIRRNNGTGERGTYLMFNMILNCEEQFMEIPSIKWFIEGWLAAKGL